LIFDEPSDLPVKMFLSLGYWLDSKSLGVTLTGIHFLNVRILDFFLVRFAPYKFLPSLNVLIFKYCNPKSNVQARRSRWAFFLSSTWSSILAPFFHLKILIKSVKTAPWQAKNWNYEEEKAMCKTTHENNKKSRRRELSKALSSAAFGSEFTTPSGIQRWHYPLVWILNNVRLLLFRVSTDSSSSTDNSADQSFFFRSIAVGWGETGMRVKS
jgi:hypothetical protein